ncbi:MAG: alpha-amylase family glycosyl hydrolase [Parvularculaceae bacterium]
MKIDSNVNVGWRALDRHTKTALAGFALAAIFLVSSPAKSEGARNTYQGRHSEDEVIYFLLPDRFENGDLNNDRGGIDGDRLSNGFDPTKKGFFHGGDLKGLISRLDYIQGLGATAIWLGPIYKNKPVQGPPGDKSAGYHGYWITDFTRVDPHFGTNDEFKEFVDAAHARGMKVFLDIITNHTADVIQLRECHDPAHLAENPRHDCDYRSKADFPYSTRGDVNGEAINQGFLGDQPPFQTQKNFDKLNQPDFAYTPFTTAEEKDIKVPAWLNNPIYYHNRGNSNWVGESALYGDFGGLDDLMTEHPRVLSGMIEIFGAWIEKFKIDGFRVDTARHVNPEFWQAFNKAMLERAKKSGISNFYIFGEAYSPNAAGLARFTRVDGFPAVLDFAFQATVQDVIVNGASARKFAELFEVDDLYEGGDAATRIAPVFVGNHDMGRFAMFVRQKHPNMRKAEIQKRVKLAHAMMFFLRGVPVIYYGDEQGFNGDGNDQASREDMFPSLTASYNDNDLIGSNASTADSNFNRRHPLYKSISKMAALYKAHPTLRRGKQILREAQNEGGVLAVSRGDGEEGEYLVVFNASDRPFNGQIAVDYRSGSWTAIAGKCPKEITAPGTVSISAPAWDYVICKSNHWSMGG